MVFAEFVEKKQRAQEAVNNYLHETWGIDSYQELAPAVLLSFSPGQDIVSAHPLTLLSHEGENWKSRTKEDPVNLGVGEDGQGVYLTISKDMAGSLLAGAGTIAFIRREEIEENEDEVYSAHEIPDSGETRDKLREIAEKVMGNGAVDFLFLGYFTEPYSGADKYYALVDFRELSGRWGDIEQFNTAKWLQTMDGRLSRPNHPPDSRMGEDETSEAIPF